MLGTWKPVVGYEGIYSVSNKGQVRRDLSCRCSKIGKILKPFFIHGYPTVNLHKRTQKTMMIHILVAESFIGRRPSKHHINHIDGNKCNNKPENLEYVTPKENNLHAIRLGLLKVAGEHNPGAKLTQKQVDKIREEFNTNITYTAIGKQYGVSRVMISLIIRNKNWRTDASSSLLLSK